MTRPASRTVRLRPSPRRSANGHELHRIAVFTALDGTLLDSRTFEAGAARSVVKRLLSSGVPVVPISVMTLEEIAPIARDLGLCHPMIIEAGGAIARPAGRSWEVEPCGPRAETFLDVVRAIEERSGARLLLYSAVPTDDAARLSGRSGPMLEASVHRSFSEPFVLESGDLDAVTSAADGMGFSVRRGRRFLYLCRTCDEAEAFERIREELRCEIAIGVGASELDADFLGRVDIPIIVPGPDGVPDQELIATVTNARIATAPAPEGWASAVDSAWQELSASTLEARRGSNR